MTNEHALSQSDCTAEFPTKKIYLGISLTNASKHSRETSPFATVHREDFASPLKETYSTDTAEMEREQENIAKNNSPLPGDTPALEKFIANELPPILMETKPLYALQKLPVASLGPHTPETADQENVWTKDVKPLAEGGATEIVRLFT